MDTPYTSLLFEKLIRIQKPWTTTRIGMEPAQKHPEMLRMAKLLKHNTLEILQYFVSRKTNAMLEGFDSKASIIKNRARGFRVLENFMNMIFFCLAGFDLPKAHLM